MSAKACIGDLVKLQRGTTYKSALLDQPGPYLLGLASIEREGGFRIDKLRTYGGPSPEKLLVYPGDIYVSLKDVTQSGDLLGSVARVSESIEVGRVTQDTVKLVFKDETFPKVYIYWLLRTPQYKSYCRARAIGTTNLSLSREDFLSYPVPSLTPIMEKVIDVLETVEKKIQINKKLNETLERMARAIFKSWFVDFEPVKAKIAAKQRWLAMQPGNEPASPVCYAPELTPNPPQHDLETTMILAAMEAISGKDEAQLTRLQAELPEQYTELRATAELFPSAMRESELGEIPEGWEVSPLSDLFELHRGFDLPQKSREEGPFEVYAAGGLHGTHRQYKMEPPGIITGRSGVIGNVYLSLKKYWPLNTTLYVRQFRASGPYYSYHLLNTLDLKSLNSGSAVPSLNRNFVHSIAVLKPDGVMLEKFEHLASSFFTEIVGNIDQNERLQDVRDTLLPKLLSGELFVSETESRVAENEESADV